MLNLLPPAPPRNGTLKGVGNAHPQLLRFTLVLLLLCSEACRYEEEEEEEEDVIEDDDDVIINPANIPPHLTLSDSDGPPLMLMLGFCDSTLPREKLRLAHPTDLDRNTFLSKLGLDFLRNDQKRDVGGAAVDLVRLKRMVFVCC